MSDNNTEPVIPINQIVHCDCLEGMRSLPDGCVDIVVTSPPYNIRNSTAVGWNGSSSGIWPNAKLQHGYEEYDDNVPHKEYVSWQRECLAEMFRLIPDNGAVFYNHKWRVQDGLLQDRSDIVSGFPVRQIIIWDRKTGMNFNKRFFIPSYEVIYLICKKDFELTKYGNSLKDVWTFGFEKKSDHPAPFPIELPERCIRATGAKVVLDPFMGSGTTAVAAKICGVDYIGFEQSGKYVRMAESRLKGLDGNGNRFF